MSPITSLELPSPAKINRFLHITGRREDGYHDLQTAFQFLDLADQLRFDLRADSQIKVACDDPKLRQETLEDNLVYKAAKLLQPFNQSSYLGADIVLNKILPMGGGLGGGSSNAATTLLALNILWQINLSLEQLMPLARQLGADVPIFIYGKTAWAEGVGDQLEPLTSDNSYFFVLKPPCHVNTSEIFSNPRLTRGTQTMTIADFLAQGGHNDCQQVVREAYPEVDNALIWLSNFAKAQLTGTGACVFASFDTYQQAQAVLQKLPKKFTAFVTQGTQESLLHKKLAEMDLLSI